MQNEQKVRVDLPSRTYTTLSQDVYDECFCLFDDDQWFLFNCYVTAGLYFSQILQFVFVMIGICKGYTGFTDIVLANILTGVYFSVMWYLLRMYKIPGLGLITSFVGGNFFRLYLHFIPIVIVAFFAAKDWKVIIFSLIGGAIALLLKTILYGFLATTNYYDKMAIYVSRLKK